MFSLLEPYYLPWFPTSYFQLPNRPREYIPRRFKPGRTVSRMASRARVGTGYPCVNCRWWTQTISSSGWRRWTLMQPCRVSPTRAETSAIGFKGDWDTSIMSDQYGPRVGSAECGGLPLACWRVGSSADAAGWL